MAMDFIRYKQLNDEKPNAGPIEGATVKAEYINGGCGDGYTLYLVMEQGRIIKASYTTTGCGFGVAALETVVGLVKGLCLKQAAALTPQDIDKAFEFPEKRKNYPQSAWEALQVALKAAQALPA